MNTCRNLASAIGYLAVVFAVATGAAGCSSASLPQLPAETPNAAQVARAAYNGSVKACLAYRGLVDSGALKADHRADEACGIVGGMCVEQEEN